jgi:molybdopterin-dependent oxidoreductase-like protein protein
MAGWARIMLAAGLALGSAGVALAQSVAVSGLAGQQVTLSAADIAAMPHQPVTLKLEGGRSEACDGVALSAILAKVGAPQGKALRGPEMADVVLVGAADGYHVALTLAETDPIMRGDQVFLADRCGGAPLPAAEGPFRMIVLGDGRPARSARQVTSITLVRVGG